MLEEYYVYLIRDLINPYSDDDLYAATFSYYPFTDDLKEILDGSPEGYNHVRVIKVYTHA